jgi:hypothetical protein
MSRHLYANITEVGICDEKGRSGISCCYKGKVVTRHETPVSDLVCALLDRINDIVGWEAVEKANADIDRAIDLLNEYRNGLGDLSDNPEGKDGVK